MKKIVYIASFCLILLSALSGEISLDIKNIFNSSSSDFTIFWDLRLPRIILAFFLGGILALSGLIFQIIFKNDLITPYTLGISSGTTLFTAFGILFFPFVYLPILSMFGSLFTVLILYFISKILYARKKILSSNNILLIGIALSYFYSSALMLLFYMSSLQENYSIMRFTLGSLDTVGFFNSLIIGIVASFMYIFISFYKQKIKLLLINNNMAFLKGLDVNKTNLILLVFISLGVGICISFTGPIGFVGLVIPHIIKLIYKKSSAYLFFPIFFFGGVFLVFCDFISRNLNTDSLLPIGVITAFIGTPIFLYLLLRKNI